MVNGHIAIAFQELAALLELAGESQFKTRAYRTFADTLTSLPEPLTAIVARGELEEMPGVGKAIAGKARELIETGTMRALEKARTEVPPTLPQLLKITGLGPARVRKIWRELGVTTVAALLDAARDGRLAGVSGIGPKAAAAIAKEAEALSTLSGFVLLGDAIALGTAIAGALHHHGAGKARIVGAVRRGDEIVRELSMIATDITPTACAEALTMNPPDGPGLTMSDAPDEPPGWVTGRPSIGGEPLVRVRCVPPNALLHALVVETATPEHLADLEERATKKATTLEAICARAIDEEEVYAALDLPPIAPELRIEPASLAIAETSRQLLAVRGVRGVFHVHTTWSDGTASIVEMARAALEAGYSYVGISDHSRAATYANGLGVERLVEQRREIEAARIEVPGIAILHGIEVDILDDGELDLPDAALAALDFVVASVHSRMQLDSAAQTKRILRAVSHPLVTILGHPTGRLLLGRAGYAFDLDAVARACAEHGTLLEINASPQRLDLHPALIRRAASLGARFCINPDAHETRGFGDVPLGVSQARRAALASAQVFNAAPIEEVMTTLRARRAAGSIALGLSAT